jgi:translation initiation factor IF-2
MPPRRYRPRRGPRPQRKRTGGAAAAVAEAQAAAARPTGPVELPNPVVVKDLAEKLVVSNAEIINVLIRNGIFATVNQSIDFDTASLVAGELGFETVEAGAAERAAAEAAAEQEIVKPGSAEDGTGR